MADAAGAGARAWARIGGTVSYSAGVHDAALPTAAFDFDSTLHPRRGRGPPAATTLAFLAGLSDTFNLVIVSNGAGGAGPTEALGEYVAALDRLRPRAATVYVPHARDRYRKPSTGTWEHYLAGPCAGARPWFAFFCGDAAGRPGDHSAADYMYALNVGIPFVTAEALFGGGPFVAAGTLLGGGAMWADPASLGCAAPAPAGLFAGRRAAGGTPRRVVLVGSPASGKSHAARESGLRVVSRDGEGGKFWQALAVAVGRGESFIVDATNPKRADRERLAALISDGAFEVWHMTTPKAVCVHLNAARCQLGERHVPAVAIHTYWARLEPPGAGEGADLGYRLREIPFALALDAPREITAFRYCA